MFGHGELSMIAWHGTTLFGAWDAEARRQTSQRHVSARTLLRKDFAPGAANVTRQPVARVVDVF